MPARLLPTITSITAFTLGLQTHAMAGVVISGDYYEQTASQICSGVLACRVDFEPIPANKFLDVAHVNCYIESSQPLKYVAMGSSAAEGGGTQRPSYLPFHSNSTGDGVNYHSINEVAKYRIGASPYLYFSARTTTASSGLISCTATGTLSPR